MASHATTTSAAEIWKFPLTPSGTRLPMFSKILSVGLQGTDPFVWALVPDTDASYVDRDLLVLGTGHAAEKAIGRDFLGTIIGVDGQFVLHVFDEEAPF